MLAPVRDLVRTGVKPVAMDDRGDLVLVRFNDNTEDVFDVVIGADGVNSWVRQTVLDGPAAEVAHLGADSLRRRRLRSQERIASKRGAVVQPQLGFL